MQYTRNSVKVEEGQWGFGQLLSVFLLLGPVVSAVEAIYTTPKTPVTTTAPPKDYTSDSDSDITTKSKTSSIDSASLCSPEEPASTPQHQTHPNPSPKPPISTVHILPLHHSPASPKTTNGPSPPPTAPITFPPPDSHAALQAHYSPSYLAATLTLAAAQIIVPLLQSAQQLTAYWSVAFIFNIAISTVFGVVGGNYFLFGTVWLATESGYGRRVLTGVGRGVGWCFRRKKREGDFKLGRGVAMVVLGAGCTVVTALSIVESKMFWDVRGDFGYMGAVVGFYLVWGVGVVVCGR